MAATALTVQACGPTGLTPSFSAPGGAGAGNGWTYQNDGSTYFRVKNASGGAIVITLKASGPPLGGVALTDQTVSIPATTGDVTIKLDPAYFGAFVTIEAASATSMTAAAFK